MNHLRSMSWLALFLVGAFVVACGDSGTGPGETDGGDGGGGGGGGRVVKADPSFANDIQEIFSRRGCTDSGCHGAAQSAGLDLRTSVAYANLVNVDAMSEDAVRVIPGNAQDSYLVIKLEGRQSVGARMPNGQAPLDDTDLTNIRNWIDQGAKNN